MAEIYNISRNIINKIIKHIRILIIYNVENI